jgi:hypothetical protein
MFRIAAFLSLTSIALPILAAAQPAASPGEQKEKPKESAKDYSEFSKLLHKLVTANVKKEVEDRSNWGHTIPLPDKLFFKKAQRTIIKVGDKLEVPHGPWTRMKAWIDDPAKDVTIQVRDFKKIDGKTLRLSLDAQASIHGEAERKRWSKGLVLFNLLVQADARFAVSLECDVKVTFKTEKFPPELLIEPKLVECKLTLNEFALRQINNVKLDDNLAKDAGNELKSYLQGLLTVSEPFVKQRINDAIVAGLKDNKGPSILELIKSLK